MYLDCDLRFFWLFKATKSFVLKLIDLCKYVYCYVVCTLSNEDVLRFSNIFKVFLEYLASRILTFY